MPLSEKVRIELFIPDLPDPIYFNLLERLGDELSYARLAAAPWSRPRVSIAQSQGLYFRIR